MVVDSQDTNLPPESDAEDPQDASTVPGGDENSESAEAGEDSPNQDESENDEDPSGGDQSGGDPSEGDGKGNGDNGHEGHDHGDTCGCDNNCGCDLPCKPCQCEWWEICGDR